MHVVNVQNKCKLHSDEQNIEYPIKTEPLWNIEILFFV